jgi:hypothetical protein
MDSWKLSEDERFYKRINEWFDLTEKYPRQLYEIDKEEYHADKIREHHQSSFRKSQKSNHRYAEMFKVSISMIIRIHVLPLFLIDQFGSLPILHSRRLITDTSPHFCSYKIAFNNLNKLPGSQPRVI